MEHRASVRAVRALASGPEAFFAALERTPDYDAGAFEQFLSTTSCSTGWRRLWRASARRPLVPDAWREQLADYQALRRVHNAELLRVSEEVCAALAGPASAAST